MKRCMCCNTMTQDNVSFCTNCGSNNFMYDNNPQYQYYNQYQNYGQGPYPQYNIAPQNNVSTTPPFLWGIVGFLIPIVGFILFFVWKNTSPKQSKAAGIGALIYVGIVIVIGILISLAIEYGQ